MKKTAILTMILSILIVAFCLSSYAQDLTGQITVLEQKADRIQNQINQAKQQAQTGLDQQVKVIQSTIDSLVNQRVQIDTHIARLESQMDEMKKSAQSTLEKQVQQYKGELSSIKQQISGMVAQKSAVATAPAPKLSDVTQQTAPQPSAPTTPGN
jgi:chromosome segregation ATPase